MSRNLPKIALIAGSALGAAWLIWAIGTSLRGSGTGFGEKTLYDWLDLLIIPAVLAIGGWQLKRADQANQNRITEQRDKADREAAAKRANVEREIAADNSREAQLQAYLDRMTELLLRNASMTFATQSASNGLMQCSKRRACIILFDHLVGALLQKPRHLQPKRLSGLEIDDEIKLRRSHHG
jgi:hypothetical protein